MSKKIVTVIFVAVLSIAYAVYGQPSPELFMMLHHSGKDSVVISVVMDNPNQVSWQCTGVLASVGYDPQKVLPAVPVPIYNKHFQQYGWEDLSNPGADNDMKYPDVMLYSEYTPNDKIPVTIKANSMRTLCRMQFLVVDKQGKTNFIFVGNTSGNGTTGWLRRSDPVQYPFARVQGLNDVWVPVTFRWIQAVPMSTGIMVSWRTEREENASYFIIERMHEQQWEIVGRVEIESENSQGASYVYLDRMIQPSTWYHYRIREIDMDGTESLSDVITTKSLSSKGVFFSARVYPNPIFDMGQLVLTTGFPGKVSIVLVDRLGRMVFTIEEGWLEQGTTVFPINRTQLSNGVYFFLIQTAEVQKIVRLTVIR